MADVPLESLLADWVDGTLDVAGERVLLERLRSASPAERSAAARNALVDRLIRLDARGPLDAEAVLRALPARAGARLASRVMRRIDETTGVVPARPRRQTPWRAARGLRWAPAAAAVLLVAATAAAWLVVRAARPRLPYGLHVDGSPVARGEVVYAADGPVRLDLGGYCRIRLDPTSALRIEGRKGDEQVYLERGRLACEVDPGHGAFAVRTEIGTVAVCGTAFDLALENVDPGRPTAGRRLVVSVSEGSVRLAGPAGDRLVRAGETAVVDPAVAAGPYTPDDEGFVRHWLLLEPIPVEPWIPEQTEGAMGPLLDRARLPNVPLPRAGDRVTVAGRSLAWRPHALDGWWAVDLESFAQSVHGTEDGVLFHGATYVVCDREIPDARLSAGSDDSSAWFLNGREVLRIYADRYVEKDMRSAPVTLRKGVNILAFTVYNRDGPTAACARFVNADGNPVRGFTVTLTPPEDGR